jgi:hypothetical protein
MPRKRWFNTPHAGGKIEMENLEIRAALDRHWAASDANDFAAEHENYQDDAVLEYPQSGERIRGRHNIQTSRFAQPNKKRFTVRRILGAADLCCGSRSGNTLFEGEAAEAWAGRWISSVPRRSARPARLRE